MHSTLLPKTPGRKGDSQVVVKMEEDCEPLLTSHTLEEDGQPREGSNKATIDPDDSNHPRNSKKVHSMTPLPANPHTRRPIRIRRAPKRLTDYSVEP